MDTYALILSVAGLLGMIAGIRSDLNCPLSDLFTVSASALLGAVVGATVAGITLLPFFIALR